MIYIEKATTASPTLSIILYRKENLPFNIKRKAGDSISTSGSRPDTEKERERQRESEKKAQQRARYSVESLLRVNRQKKNKQIFYTSLYCTNVRY